VSAGTVQPVSSTADWRLDTPNDRPSSLPVADSGIDDPVNDTGLGPPRGDLQLPDLQLSDEFACLLSMICEGSGEFS
jgi:hypothetical protein